MYVLGIESSCDETSASVLHDGKLLSNIISSQYFHSEFGGVVPELASRAHIKSIVPIIDQALKEADITIEDIDLCAVTHGPGLIGSLLVGLNFAKGFVLSRSIPIIPVHHIEAHIFSTFLRDPHPEFPFLALVVSGGHTLIILVHELNKYAVLGSTVDDAAGEAFDKVAKLLGFGFPGGPHIDSYAQNGNPHAISFPKSNINDNKFDFSFSGIKTSVLYFLRRYQKSNQNIIPSENKKMIYDIAASFQKTVVDVLTDKIFLAADEYQINDIAVVGGVSANSELQSKMHHIAIERNKNVFIPSLFFSTDNAAMVAQLGYMKWKNGFTSDINLGAFARSPKFSFQ